MSIVYVFFSAVLDTNGKMTTFFVLPILQKLKPEGFFHHKEFLKEISSISGFSEVWDVTDVK